MKPLSGFIASTKHTPAIMSYFGILNADYKIFHKRKNLRTKVFLYFLYPKLGFYIMKPKSSSVRPFVSAIHSLFCPIANICSIKTPAIRKTATHITCYNAYGYLIGSRSPKPASINKILCEGVRTLVMTKAQEI